MKLFDCTLRDGANVVGNGFSKELTESMVKGLLECGIKDIELGNAKGLGGYDQLGALAPLTDKEYMELVRPYSEKGRLGMFILAKLTTEDRVKLAADNGLSFLRVGANAGDGMAAADAVQIVKAAGLTCRYSLMKAYVLSPDELAEEAKLLEAAGVDRITIMDSAGTMLPNDAAAYIIALKKAISIPVGFHGHSNLGMSQANARAAFKAGADEIDGGLLGMARSAGNCATELAIAILQRMGCFQDIDLYKLLSYLDSELIPAMATYDYRPAVCPTDLILGLTGCHSSFLPVFKKIAAEKQVSLYRLITEVSAIDRKNPSEKLIIETADKIHLLNQ